MISETVVRISSNKRENIFKIENIDDLKSHQLIYKMLHLKQEDKNLVSNEIFYSENPRIFKLRYQVEFYFADYNYFHDKHLQRLAEEGKGWITITDILPFKRMRDLEATSADIVNAIKNS
jgi:hypothetical protein